MKSKRISLLLIIFFLIGCRPNRIRPESASALTPAKTSIEPTKIIEQQKSARVLLDYAFSPDGKRLALFKNTGIYIYDLNSMQESIFLEFDNDVYTQIRSGAVAFSPDGKRIAISGKFDEAVVTIWDIESQMPITTIQDLPDKHFITEIGFSPNGKSLIVRNTYTEANNCQGYISDKMTLHDIENNKKIFEIEKCNIYPPIRFRFASNDTVFIYSGSMSNEYSVYFVDTNSGQIISRDDLDWSKDGNFYDISTDGKMCLIEKGDKEKRITYIIDSESNEVVASIEGKIVILYKENDFVVSSYVPNSEWSFWEDGIYKCTYSGIKLSPEIKTSANKEVFMVMESETEFQIWKVSTCEMIGKLQFDK
jgi:WD40 repeat protein